MYVINYTSRNGTPLKLTAQDIVELRQIMKELQEMNATEVVVTKSNERKETE